MNTLLITGQRNEDHSLDKNLHESLVALARADIERDYLCIRAKKQHGLSNIQVNQLQMGIILHGEKQLNSPLVQMNLNSGDIIFMKPDTLIDATNIPEQYSGEYLSILVPICDEVIQATQMIWAKPILDKSSDVLKFTIADFSTELTEWQSALFQHDLAKARLCIASILLKLCQNGFADVLLLPPPKLAKIIYQWVFEDPQHNWLSSEIEMKLGISSATLRRKLSAEGTSLREVITQARLAKAIELLYSNKLPMKTIAAKSGYQSLEAFRERFIKRYGFDPSILVIE